MKSSLKAYFFLIAMTLLIFAWFFSRGVFKKSHNALDLISADIEGHDKPLGSASIQEPATAPQPAATQTAAAAAPGAAPTPTPSYTPNTDLGAAVNAIRKKSERSNKQLEDSLKQ